MKKLILLCSACFFFIQCNKNDIASGEIRLLKTKYVDAGNGDVYYFSFEYDQAGRIIRLLSSKNNETPLTIATVSYNSNKVTILPDPVHNAGFDYIDEIEYTVDANNKPLQRIQNVYREFKPLVSNLQKDFETDTANYEYDAAGLLVKVKGSSRDSTWFDPGTLIQTYTYNRQNTSLYTNSGSNLGKIAKTTQQEHRFICGAVDILTKRNIEESYMYEYNHAYTNKTDFTNALILTEFSVLYDNAYPLNKNYKNVPDKISYSRITRDAATGAIVESDNNITNVALGFNNSKFITFINFGITPAGKKEFIYNR
ncbi:MAG: hypothetical protein WDO71_06485 [Bacteroidota bacterium]